MAEVFIAGAGIIGSSIAWKLARAGMSVELADAGIMGKEASWAGAGMLAPGGEFDKASVWADLARESMASYPAFLRELASASGVVIDWRISGALELAFTKEERARLAQRARAQEELGIVSRDCAEGRYYPADGWVNPRQVLDALRTACERLGVRLRERCRVERLEAGGYGAVVIAAGAWSSQIAVTSGGVLVPLPEVSPVKGHLIGYEMEPGTLGCIRRSGHSYLLQRSDGFTVAGSVEENVGFNREVDAAICRDLQARASRLWPALEARTPEQRWIGFRPKPASGLPHIGRVAGSNIWLAYGHYRNGILLAPVTATKIAGELIASLERD